MTALPLPARHEFTKRLRAMIFERANGCCESCGCKVGGSVAYDIDHVVPAYAGGKATLENGQVLCKALCHREKTRRDNQAAKKSNRIRGLTGQRARREKRGGSSIQGRSDWPKGRKLQSCNTLRKGERTTPFERERLKAMREPTPIEELADA